MCRNKLVNWWAAGVLGMLPVAAWGQTGPFSIQGELRDANGNPVNAPAGLPMTVQLFDQNNVALSNQFPANPNPPVVNGRYTIKDIVLAPAAGQDARQFFNGADRFIELRVNGVALNPKIRVQGAPFALGLKLPMSLAANSAQTLFELTNGGVGNAIEGIAANGNGNAGFGVVGTSNGALTAGVGGLNDDNLGMGVFGDSINGTGVFGQSAGANRAGVAGVNDLAAGTGVVGRSAAGIGVKGWDGAGSGLLAVLPVAPFAVLGDISAAGHGVIGLTANLDGTGVYGRADGVLFDGGIAAGVEGNSWNDVGVWGESVNGVGNVGWSVNGWGILGVRGAATPFPTFAFAAAITGDTNSGNGVVGTSAANGGAGLFGDCLGPLSAGARGVTNSGVGVAGDSTTGIGVLGRRGIVTGMPLINPAAIVGDTAVGDGVTGLANAAGTAGVVGRTNNGLSSGVVGINIAGGLAGLFQGNVLVQGNFDVTGVVGAAVKAFRIDHPVDPANKVLMHACIESDQMANIYSGNVTTDAEGRAVVTLPGYFDALNADCRYQLTVVGQFAQAIVAERVHGNRFTIRTDKPGVDVSWQVTGIRKDAFALAHPLVVESDKPTDQRGRYMHPIEHGKPASQSMYAHFYRYDGAPSTADQSTNPGGRSDKPINKIPDISTGGAMGRLTDAPQAAPDVNGDRSIVIPTPKPLVSNSGSPSSSSDAN